MARTDDETERFLVTMPSIDVARVEHQAKIQRMSRNRYVMMAVLAMLEKDERMSGLLKIDKPIEGSGENNG